MTTANEQEVRRCDNCGRPAWKAHGGMGGHIMPDSEENCTHHKGAFCRAAAVSKRLAEEKAQVEIARLEKELADAKFLGREWEKGMVEAEEERDGLKVDLENALYDLDQARAQLGDYYE